jgi:uncharacterized protein YkwD
MMPWVWILFVVNMVYSDGYKAPSASEQMYMLEAVNKIRSKGCYCGKRYMKPAQKVTWNSVLYQSAVEQATQMDKYNFFDHYSIDGKNIGERLEKVGYNWIVAGENLGEGQTTFDEVLRDWMKSYTHCIMVMNPKVEEMAVAKVNRFWVQHFGKKSTQ